MPDIQIIELAEDTAPADDDSFAKQSPGGTDKRVELSTIKEAAALEAPPTLEKNINYTIVGATDGMIEVDATGGNRTITFPADLSGLSRKRYTIMKMDASANTVTIDGDGNNINGDATQVLYSRYDALTIGVSFDETQLLILET